jgi:hypothetical protein
MEPSPLFSLFFQELQRIAPDQATAIAVEREEARRRRLQRSAATPCERQRAKRARDATYDDNHINYYATEELLDTDERLDFDIPDRQRLHLLCDTAAKSLQVLFSHAVCVRCKSIRIKRRKGQ